MTDWLLEELAAAHQSRTPCALVTVAATKGSVPRAAGSKMLVFADGETSGTVGGGKFEALVIDAARNQIREKTPLLKTYPLHEASPESFGAICGGEITVLIEPQVVAEAIFLIGAGHCANAIAKLAVDCGLAATVVDDRHELMANLPSRVVAVSDATPAQFIKSRKWQSDEALVLVSRNYEVDRDALAAALEIDGAGYIGMIGSTRKVQRVFEQLKDRKVPDAKLARVYAPLGLDIGADSPAEIAVSVMAEVLAVLRKRSGHHLREVSLQR
jgi:xanthine dehydrogenase accessory factor